MSGRFLSTLYYDICFGILDGNKIGCDLFVQVAACLTDGFNPCLLGFRLCALMVGE